MKNKSNPKLVKMIEEEFTSSDWEFLNNWVDVKNLKKQIYQIAEKWRKEGIEEIMNVLKKELAVADDEEKKGWAEHCSCLRHAIWTIEELKQKK